MTTIAEKPDSGGSSRALDVRCSAALPGMSGSAGRCQLFAGHDGPHAVLYVHCGRRTVRHWRASDGASDAAADSAADSAAMSRPWMYGYPAPAWFETDAG